MGIRQAIEQLCSDVPLTRADAVAAMREIVRGEATSAQIAGYLTALRTRGETAAVVSGSAEAMLEHSVRLPIPGDDLIDTCGTGGDGAGSFNVSTAAALIAAGAGCRVAKHGNRSVSSRCGSADVLEALGVKIDLGPDQVARCIERTGMGFLYAPRFHPGMKFAMGARRELGVRTMFNVLGPICNPARPLRQVVGVFARPVLALIGDSLRALGARHALVIHSNQGLDEATTGGTNYLYRVTPERAEATELAAASLGLSQIDAAELAGGTTLDNARMMMELLEGAGRPGPRDTALLNAALVIHTARDGGTLVDALANARESLASGRAHEVLRALRTVSHE